jgi:hypothetical protein
MEHFFLKDSSGNLLPETSIGVVKKNYAPHLRDLMEQMCKRINSEVSVREICLTQTITPTMRILQFFLYKGSGDEPFISPSDHQPFVVVYSDNFRRTLFAFL